MTAQGPIHIKLIACKRLLKTPAQYNLKNIAPVTAFLAFFYHGYVFLIGKIRCFFTNSIERINRYIFAFYK